MEKQTTIKFSELKRLQFCNSDKLPQLISRGGRRLQWVGIGWIDEGPSGNVETIVIED